jgi:hypothetical protein
MPGLVPGIHVLGSLKKVVDGRVKPGHDVEVSRGGERERKAGASLAPTPS